MSDVITVLMQQLLDAIKRDGFSEGAMYEIEINVRQQFGGQETYVQKVNHQARRNLVKERFNGRNRQELCKNLGLSKSQFYEILKSG